MLSTVKTQDAALGWEEFVEECKASGIEVINHRLSLCSHPRVRIRNNEGVYYTVTACRLDHDTFVIELGEIEPDVC